MVKQPSPLRMLGLDIPRGAIIRHRKFSEFGHTWLLEWTPPGSEPRGVELTSEPGRETHELLAFLMMGGLEFRTEREEEREAICGLLRSAAETKGWRLWEDGTRRSLPSEQVRAQLAYIAEVISALGVWDPENLPPSLPPPSKMHRQLPIPSVGHYAALQEAFAKKLFEQTPETRFPRAKLEKGGVIGYAELRQVTPEEELLLPPAEADALAQLMWRHREELSDRDADALDAVSACWLREARSSSDRIAVYVDEVLRMRGLKPKRGGTGRRGGFEPEQRAEVFRSLLHLQDVWLDIADVTVYEEQGTKKAKPRRRALQSRAFVMTDRVGQRRLDGSMDVEAVLVTPGTAFGRFLFGPGRQVALLSANALRYDPVRQKAEKRLVRYLSWQWRIAASRGDWTRSYRVRTLVQEIGLESASNDPQRLRNRMEKCLDTLQQNGDIASWQYGEGWDEDALPRQGWLPQWLGASITLEAPDVVKGGYSRLDQVGSPAAERARLTDGASWAERLRKHRELLGMSQLEAAQQIGISQPYLSQLEAGRKDPSAKIARQLREWLKGG